MHVRVCTCVCARACVRATGKKNEALKVKDAQQKAKAKKEEERLRAKEEKEAAQRMHTMLSNDANLGEAEFQKRVEPVFRMMDKDGSGSIDIDELRKVRMVLRASHDDRAASAQS